jgi:hypothetical protein
VLQLGQLTHPGDLDAAWQHQVLPACLAAWQQLRAGMGACVRAYMQRAAPDAAAATPAAPPAAAAQAADAHQQQQVAQLLAQLDSLLGTLQQVRAKDGWRVRSGDGRVRAHASATV